MKAGQTTRRMLVKAVSRAGITRRRVSAGRMCVERSVIAGLRRPPVSRRSRILAYHAVGTPVWGVNDLSPARFRRHLELILDAGFRFVHPDEIAANPDLEKALAVTFDDGLTSVLENAAPILHELSIPWSMFIVSDWAENSNATYESGTLANWRQVEEMARYGATIGSHSVSHADFGILSAEQAAEELFQSREMIAQRTGVRPDAFAIPFGQSANWTGVAAEAARAAGYKIVYAQAEDTRFPGTVARTKVVRTDVDFVFKAALSGAFDHWEEWF